MEPDAVWLRGNVVESTSLALAVIYFLVANPIGNSPAILSLIKHCDFARQKQIVFREAMISLAIILFFQYVGEIFLGMLKVSDYALTITGGLVLFLTSLQMLFHKPESAAEAANKTEPFIVPIATPLIAGPGLMTMVMVSSKEVGNNFVITLAILIAWIGVTLVLVGAPYVQKLIGKRGMAALEQVMGMILALISTAMLFNGFALFIKTLK
jgi:multiple antibiotic resistance protein